MAATTVSNAPWSRKHDDPGRPLISSASTIAYPTSLAEVIDLLSARSTDERVHAAGSHWGLSRAAVSDTVFVETHDPGNAFPAMGRTLYEVVPRCLSEQFVAALAERTVLPFDVEHNAVDEGLYPVHFETGKRVYQAYAEMDLGDDLNEESLAALLRRDFGNSSYLGPWAFPTLGGAGGQTVFGALTTGTHGGDFRKPPIADAVLAMHLVIDGGRHLWIERSPDPDRPVMTDDAKLRALYGVAEFGGPDNFDIHRDDNLFYSVLMAAGRFGIVYSVVVGAVRQYSLHQERRLLLWQDIKSQIALGPEGPLFTLPDGSPNIQKFLQVAVCLTTHDNFQKNLCGVTKRWNVPLAARPGTSVPAGRDERRGEVIEKFDNQIAAPRFSRAGNSRGYSPDPAKPNEAAPPSFLERACSDGDFMIGVIRVVAEEIHQFVTTNTVPIGGAMAAVAAVAGAATLLALLVALAVILALLLAFLAALAASGNRLGETLDGLRNILLNRADPNERAAGVLAWQCIAFQLFSSQQSDLDYKAISYAMMDGHDYLDLSCNVNVDSVEVFFDARDPMLVPFVDALIAFEARQEFSGRAFAGYASLRFTSRTAALIGPEQHALTCVVEVAGLVDVRGSAEVVRFAETLAQNRNFNGILHWGQRNNSTSADIEHRFGDSADMPGGRLGTWRAALASVTANGRLDGCSNAFTRQTGLEVVRPVFGTITAQPPAPARGGTFTVRWDCADNPPGTQVYVIVRTPSGGQTEAGPLPVGGEIMVPAGESGTYLVSGAAVLVASGGDARQDARQIDVTVS